MYGGLGLRWLLRPSVLCMPAVWVALAVCNVSLGQRARGWPSAILFEAGPGEVLVLSPAGWLGSYPRHAQVVHAPQPAGTPTSY